MGKWGEALACICVFCIRTSEENRSFDVYDF